MLKTNTTPEMFHVEHSEPLGRFSPCRRYRYELWRRWASGPFVQWLMLNPSTADETQLDPTLRRCMAYSKAWGFGAMCITNLFAYRATDPEEMFRNVWTVEEPENDRTIVSIAQRAGLIVLGWGNHGQFLGRASHVLGLLHDRRLSCLKLNAGGTPAHPLYLKRTLKPVDWVRSIQNG